VTVSLNPGLTMLSRTQNIFTARQLVEASLNRRTA